MKEQFEIVGNVFADMEKEILRLRDENQMLKGNINGMAEELRKRGESLLRGPQAPSGYASEMGTQPKGW